MSGGIGYVVDLDPARVNPEMVDLDPLGPDDEDLVRSLLARHAEETDSPVAAALLEAWDPGRLTKVMPRDYKRVLAARAEAQARGVDPLVAVMGGING
jgi:glutamate synthase (NADPH/NADH) large chain